MSLEVEFLVGRDASWGAYYTENVGNICPENRVEISTDDAQVVMSCDGPALLRRLTELAELFDWPT